MYKKTIIIEAGMVVQIEVGKQKSRDNTVQV